MRTVSSGVPDLDMFFGDGLLVGDNIIWIADQAVYEAVDRPLLTPTSDGGTRVFAAVTTPPQEASRRLGPGVEVLDARPGKPLSDPHTFSQTLVERGRTPGTRIAIEDFDPIIKRIGPDKAITLFTRTCPVLFDLGALAYWRMSRNSGAVVDAIRKMTQCVIEVKQDQLRVIKAERRPHAEGKIVSADVRDGTLHLGPEKALGRLAAGLRKIRTDRGINQTELARLAGVSPSAVSQAEAGTRGLGLDTLLQLSQTLQMGIDDILANRPSGDYVIARRDSHLAHSGTTPLFDDPSQGMRGYLVELGPGESGAPQTPHKDAEAILVTSGLIKVDLDVETPVLRAGDAILATRVQVRGWTNLLGKPSRLFWILRESGRSER